MLLGDSVGCLTVIYDSSQTGKISIPNLEKRNDYALWCIILNKVKVGYKYCEILSLYRKGENSNTLSGGSKVKLLKYHYIVHRKINGFNSIKAGYFTFTNGINYILNRLVREKKMNGE